MNVAELIKELEQIEDKSMPVIIMGNGDFIEDAYKMSSVSELRDFVMINHCFEKARG